MSGQRSSFDAGVPVGVLLRLEQCSRGHRVAERLHELAHDDALPGDFIFQLRVTLFRGNLFREVSYHRRQDTRRCGHLKAHRIVVYCQ